MFQVGKFYKHKHGGPVYSIHRTLGNTAYVTWEEGMPEYKWIHAGQMFHNYIEVQENGDPMPEVIDAPREFQVGDRVRCVLADHWSEVGWEGTVTTRHGGGEMNTRVRWDNAFHFWIKQENLVLIAAAPEVPVVEEEPKPVEETYIYLAWISSVRGNKFSYSSHDEEAFNRHLHTLQGQGATILAKKRIKFNI